MRRLDHQFGNDGVRYLFDLNQRQAHRLLGILDLL